MANGFNQVVIANSDTPDHQDLYRFVDGEGILTAIRIAEDLPPDAVFNDYHVASGVSVRYFARAYLTAGSSGGYTDSDATDAITGDLDGLWITEVTTDSTTTNAAQSLNLFITGARRIPQYESESRKFDGRTAELTIFGQQTGLVLSYDVVVPLAEISKLETLQSLLDANTTLCIRDNLGNRMFGRLNSIPFSDLIVGDFFSLTFLEEDFDEEV